MGVGWWRLSGGGECGLFDGLVARVVVGWWGKRARKKRGFALWGRRRGGRVGGRGECLCSLLVELRWRGGCCGSRRSLLGGGWVGQVAPSLGGQSGSHLDRRRLGSWVLRGGGRRCERYRIRRGYSLRESGVTLGHRRGSRLVGLVGEEKFPARNPTIWFGGRFGD